MRRGASIAYFGGDPQKIVPELQEVKPTYFPSVPRIFEKIYTLAAPAIKEKAGDEQFKGMVGLGVKVRDLEHAGQEVPAELREKFDPIDEKVFAGVRAIFGGRLRQAVTGAAPIAREILEFFYAAGVPVLEGYGMTETSTVATYSTKDEHRFGTVGRALPGCEIKIADDGEILIKGNNIFEGYYKNDDASFGAVVDGWLHTGDLGSLDEDGYLSITGRKKDIIITAGGKNLTPANLENDLKQVRWVSQAVMHGDRRPFPSMLITLDPEEIGPWAAEHDKPNDAAALAKDPEVIAMIQAELDKANSHYAQVEQVKKFFILDHDLSQETGELTPTMKVKRNVVNEKYEKEFDALYGGEAGAGALQLLRGGLVSLWRRQPSTPGRQPKSFCATNAAATTPDSASTINRNPRPSPLHAQTSSPASAANTRTDPRTASTGRSHTAARTKSTAATATAP